MQRKTSTILTSSAMGRIGEKAFSTACSMSNITCNPSTEDDHGWDFLVEWPAQHYEGSADTAPDLVRAQIQVKTTRSDKPIAKLKLSAALNLAKAAIPAFIVLVRITPSGELVSFAVIHMWCDAISRTLSRVRQAEQEAKVIWHQAITYRTNRIFEHASQMLDAIHDDISAQGPKYVATKSAFEKDVGYDALGSEMKVTFNLESEDELIDWSLGLGDGLTVSKLDAWTSRFGITLPDRRLTGSTGKMFVEPKGRDATLQFRLPEGTSFSEPVEVIASALPGLPSEKQRFRLRCDLFDVVIGGGASTTFSVKADLGASELQPLARIHRVAALRSLENGSQIGLTLRADGKSQSIGSINFNGETFSPYWGVIAAGLPFLIEISNLALDSSDAILADLFMHETLWALDIIGKLAGRRNLRIVFDSEPDLAETCRTMRGHFGVPIGGVWYHALFEWPITSDTFGDDGRRQITCGPASIRDALVDRPLEENSQPVAEYFNTAVDELPEPETSLYVGDFRTLLTE